MYGMFTMAGNVAVEKIVEDRLSPANTPNEAYKFIHEDLERLQTIPVFSEATDTEVRESVWSKINQHFRKKEVDTAAC